MAGEVEVGGNSMSVPKPAGQFSDKRQTPTVRRESVKLSLTEEGCPKTLLLRGYGTRDSLVTTSRPLATKLQPTNAQPASNESGKKHASHRGPPYPTLPYRHLPED